MLAEESDQFANLIRILETGGAHTPQGWQIRQVDLAELAGYKTVRALYVHLRKMKADRLVVVRHHARGSGSDLIREADSYHLKVGYERWLEIRPEVVAKLRRRSEAKRQAAFAATRMERERTFRKAERLVAAGKVATIPPPPPKVSDAEAVQGRVSRMGTDEDLKGW